MPGAEVILLDLNFLGRSRAIASYLIRHSDGAILVECGPGSTLHTLEQRLKEQGLGLKHVTHVLLTHIHLDHAGAAGALARYGAKIYVHPVGAPHMINPEKLLASAARIYGDQMQTLWGEFLPVSPEQIVIPEDGKAFTIGNLEFLPLNTPGHAEHHFAYLFQDLCFSGDIGGVRIFPHRYLRLPMPPPEFHLEKWRQSVARLRSVSFRRIAPTHFGIFDDAEWHLQALEENLNAVEQWLERVMPSDPPLESLRRLFTDWMTEQERLSGLSAETVATYQIANPPGMSADGLLRYWKKYRISSSS
jgi:glyoxylase-like metal-dependent hydrolase (beta-lactamase superfamily II)